MKKIKKIKKLLRSGMIVKTREGSYGLVMLNTFYGDAIVGWGNGDKDLKTTWGSLSSYDDDLKRWDLEDGYSHDIVSIYGFLSNMDAAEKTLINRVLLWERK